MSTTSFGKYLLEKKLGQGGMGTVYLAFDSSLSRKVALKVIISDDKEMLERFQREAHAVAKLKHPNIIQVYEAGIVGKQHYFTMDYIDGTSLDKLIQEKPKPAINTIMRVILQVALALHYAHSQRIIHRDIKPANILIDKKGNAYIADFGLAKQLTGLDRSLTLTGTTIGTPDYMAPEQAAGKKDEIDPRSDIFSLGATIYHCLTMRRPFQGKQLYEVLSKIINEEPPTPSSFIRLLPKEVETICLKCLEKDKAKRYQTAMEVAADIKRYLSGGSITAQRSSSASKLYKKAKRNKLAVIGIASAVVILLAVTINYLVTSAQTNRKISEQRNAAYSYFTRGDIENSRLACQKVLELVPDDRDMKLLLEKCVAATVEKEAEAKKKLDKINEQEEQVRKSQEQAKAKEEEIKKTQEQIKEQEKAALKIQEEIRKKEEQIKAAAKQSERRGDAKTVLDRASMTPSPDQRIKIAREALDIDPNFGDAYQVMGCAYRDKKEFDKAYECFTRAIGLSPKSAYAYYERGMITAYTYNKPEEAISDFQKVLEYDPNSHIGYFAKGGIELHQKKYDEAIKSYTRAIELYPEYTWAYINRGTNYQKKGELDKALNDYNEAIKLSPKNSMAYYNRGNTYQDKGEIDKALADYSEALKLNPKYAEVYNNRGIIYRDRGNLDKAVAEYTEAIKANPKLANAYYNRGFIYSQRGDLDKAIKDFTEMIRLDPKYSDAYNERGIAYSQKGELDKAIRDYNEALKLDPKDAEAYTNRGTAYSQKGESAKALADYNQSIKLDPKKAATYVSRGNAYADQGELDKALADYNEAIRLDPKLAEAYGNRALTYAKKNEFRQAITDGNTFIKLAPNHPFVKEIKRMIEEWKQKTR